MPLEPTSDPQLLITTDLDGTLLDHHDYHFDPVLPVLDRLRAADIPLVANTSKTRSEWLAMREQFQNEDAFVIENGSAMHLPNGKMQGFGTAHKAILDELRELKDNFNFRGFSDLDLEGIVEHTGLGSDEAERAGHREFSEPLLWEDSDESLTKFIAEIHRRGLKTLQGGRFLHILGQTDKAKPLPSLREFYQADVVVAIGDSANDLAMVEQADIGIIIASPTAPFLEAPKARRLIRSTAQGPEGWAETMTHLLDEFSL